MSYLHAPAGQVKEQIAEVQVYDSAEVVPPESRRVVHEEVGNANSHKAPNKSPEATIDHHP